jgi:hypothetical protein
MIHCLDAHTAPTLFRRALQRFLEPDEALSRIREYPGIIPVAIDPGYRVIWLDVADNPFHEWKFRFSVHNLLEQQGVGDCFSTGIRIFSMPEFTLGSHPVPAGFIFHMSKCGSSAIARVLDQSTRHVVLKEPTPLHENLWQYLTGEWQHPVIATDENLRLVRNLLQAIGRTRLPGQHSYFVKFRSWTTAFVDVIQQAFPETPSLFMYREPVKVMASIMSKPTTGLPRLTACGAAAYITRLSSRELCTLDTLDYFTHFYRQYLGISLTQMREDTQYLNYRDMTKQTLSKILFEAFHYLPPDSTFSAMLAQLDVYAKDDSGKTRFASDEVQKDRLVTPAMRKAAEVHLMGLYHQLEGHSNNLRWRLDCSR